LNVAAVAAVIFSVITIGVIAFQLALALGVPCGSYAMGGAFPGKFPPAMRVAAVAQAVLLAAMAGLMLSFAGLAVPQWSDAPDWLGWAVVAFSAVGLVLNWITPSAGERRIWVPVAIVMLGSSLAVMLTAQ
jgi:hypothetical protein